LQSDHLDLRSRFKGIIVGNPWVSFGTGLVSRAHALWGQQLLPRPLWKDFVTAGCDSMDTDDYLSFLGGRCGILMQKMLRIITPYIDLCKNPS
jgi:hypothetical protein